MSGAKLPLAFIGLGLVSLTVAITWLVFDSSLPLMPHVHPTVVALAHLWLPGFLLSVCFGAAYQLAPVVLGVPIRGERSAWLHFGLHGAGLPVLVLGFAQSRFDIVAAGGSLIAIGAALFAVAVVRTFRASERRDAIAWSLSLSAGWLVFTVTAGVAIALNRRWPMVGWSSLALLRAHAHLGLIGFFLTLIQGMAFQLVPMFTLAEVRRPWCVKTGLCATQLGLLTLAPGLACEQSVVSATGAGLLVLGVTFTGVALFGTLASRRKRILEPGLRAFLLGATLIGTSALGGVTLVMAAPSLVTLRGAMAYGVLVVPGALALMVLGMLCKIIPFLVWMRAYGSRVGRQPVPAAGTLANARWERSWLWSHGLALGLLASGALFAQTSVIRAGAFLLFIGVCFFLLNTVRVLLHLRPAQVLAAPPAMAKTL